jgi:hypothetical protein
VRHLELEVVEAQHKRLGLPGFVLLEVVGRHELYLLLQTAEEGVLEPAPEAEEGVDEV